jgi:hypothetical protein
VTLKITASNSIDEDVANHELNITRQLMTNPSHDGFEFVRHMLDNFKVTGPGGTHLCLVYEPMRVPLWQFQQRLPNSKNSTGTPQSIFGISLAEARLSSF